MHPPDDDHDLFRRLFGDVKRVRSDKIHHGSEKPEPTARFRRDDESRVLGESVTGAVDPADLETGEELSFRRPQVRIADFRRLRRGQFSVADEIDLHGLSAEQARQAVVQRMADVILLAEEAARQGLADDPRLDRILDFRLRQAANRELYRRHVRQKHGQAAGGAHHRGGGNSQQRLLALRFSSQGSNRRGDQVRAQGQRPRGRECRG